MDDKVFLYNRAVRCARFAAVATLFCSFLSADEKLNKFNFAVLDHQGQPVTGLEAADFQLQEDGKARNIAFFRFTGDPPLQAKKPDQGPPPGEHSNRAGVPAHVTVILIDLLSDRMLSGSIISEEVTRAFKNLESSENLYLYFLTSGGELYPVHPLPKPGTEVVAATEPWTRNLGPMLQGALKNLVGIKPVDDRDTKVRFDLTMHAMRELGSQMELISGRKNLVWVTRGIPLYGPSISEQGRVDLTNPLRLVCQLLERVQIAVYPVGAALASESDQLLEEFSSITGGRKYASNEVSEAVKQATLDARGNYEIAYYSPVVKPDGKHHKLRLICSHKDVRLLVEPGYYAMFPQPNPADMQRMDFEIALRSPFDATDIGLRASAAPDPTAPQKTRFDIHIDAADLLLHQGPDHRTGKIALLFANYGASGLQQPANPFTIDVSLTPEQYETAKRGGLEFHQSMATAADVRKVRVIVVDEELGAAGSVTLPLEH